MKIDVLTPDTAILQELGSRLAKIRKVQGYSQDKLAAEAGLGVATLRRVEDGKDAHLGSWLKLLKVLGMTTSIDTLLPESYNSPMAEVLSAKEAKTKIGKGSQVKGDRLVWGDETQ